MKGDSGDGGEWKCSVGMGRREQTGGQQRLDGTIPGQGYPAQLPDPAASGDRARQTGGSQAKEDDLSGWSSSDVKRHLHGSVGRARATPDLGGCEFKLHKRCRNYLKLKNKKSLPYNPLPPPNEGQDPSSLVIKVVALELGHVAFEGGDVLAQDAPLGPNLQNVTCG